MINHKTLCGLAVKWLYRPHSKGGPGCQLAVSEVGGSSPGEITDAIGWRYDCSVVVECKTSRADFLADQKKPHRVDPAKGAGVFRYYMCPEGLIDFSERPPGWGLIYVNKRHHIKPIAGHINHLRWGKCVENGWFFEANQQREKAILISLFRKIHGDPEEINRNIRAAYTERDRWKRRYDDCYHRMVRYGNELNALRAQE